MNLLKAVMQTSQLSQNSLLTALPTLNQGRCSLIVQGKVVATRKEGRLLEQFFHPLTIDELMEENHR